MACGIHFDMDGAFPAFLAMLGDGTDILDAVGGLTVVTVRDSSRLGW